MKNVSCAYTCGRRRSVAKVRKGWAGVAAAFAILAAGLLSAKAHAAVIVAQASVQQSGPAFGSDSAGGNSNGITPLIDTATFGGNTAAFSLTPAQHAGTITGQSAPIAFSAWSAFGYESSAQAYVQITGSVQITSPLDILTEMGFEVNWGGTLLPNADFEQQYQAALGQPTSTARASHTLYFGTPGNLQLVGSREVGSQGVDKRINLTDGTLFFADDDHRRFAFSLTLGGYGSRGGGFALAGSAGAAAALALEAEQAAGIRDKSFFEIVLTVPPGTTLASDAPYLRVVKVPEPGTGLVVAAGALVMARRRQRAVTGRDSRACAMD